MQFINKPDSLIIDYQDPGYWYATNPDRFWAKIATYCTVLQLNCQWALLPCTRKYMKRSI